MGICNSKIVGEMYFDDGSPLLSIKSFPFVSSKSLDVDVEEISALFTYEQFNGLKNDVHFSNRKVYLVIKGELILMIHKSDVMVSALRKFSSSLLSSTGTLLRRVGPGQILHLYDFIADPNCDDLEFADYKLSLSASSTINDNITEMPVVVSCSADILNTLPIEGVLTSNATNHAFRRNAFGLSYQSLTQCTLFDGLGNAAIKCLGLLMNFIRVPAGCILTQTGTHLFFFIRCFPFQFIKILCT